MEDKTPSRLGWMDDVGWECIFEFRWFGLAASHRGMGAMRTVARDDPPLARAT